MDFEFRVPETIPQDILLIQDIVGVVPCTKGVQAPVDSSDDSIASSSSEIDSEDEVEADLLLLDEESSNRTPVRPRSPESDSSSDSNSHSESDEDEPVEQAGDKNALNSRKPQINVDDDDELGATAVTSYMQTKNEIVETDVMIPCVSEVEPQEVLERVGEVINIVGNVVIVKGLPADSFRTASERALDTETLLVFSDRKVLGYIYETFGPTSQPLYQIKFNHSYPLDTEKIRVARDVYHIPQRSNFVFMEHLEKFRGSDASNIHDEEPGEDEIEFSDDEQEAAFKQSRRKKRGMSVSSSRQTTPVSPQAYDNYNDSTNDMFYGANPYDAHGPYDEGYGVAGPSRPAPMPYDDPYADEVKIDYMEHEGESFSHSSEAHSAGREAERSIGNCRVRGRMRGRGRDRIGGARGRGRGRGRRSWGEPRVQQSQYNRSPSPAYDAMEHTTAQPSPGMPVYPTSQPFSSPPTWGCQPGHSFGQDDVVQPHINPRFASAFGFNVGGPPAWYGSQQDEFNCYPAPQAAPSWTNQWLMQGQSDTYTPM